MRSLVHVAAVASIAAVATLTPSTAQADEVPPTGKGIVGGALLGGEIVTLPMALGGVQSGTAYIVGGLLGAAAGGVGGYFVEQSVDDGRVPVYMLAGGLALVIPTIVLALNATSYKPIEGAKEDRAPGPPADPGAVGGSVVIGGGSSSPAPAPAPSPATTPAAPPPAGSPAPTTPAPGGPGSFLDMPLHKGFAPRLGVPVPEVRPMVSMADQKRLGVASGGTEVRVPVVHVTF